MTDVFELAHGFTAKWEGGISDDKADPGGFTMYGVATHFLKDLDSRKDGRRFLLELGVILPVTRANMLASITPGRAKAIFKREFWDSGAGGLPEPLNVVAYDFGVNCGVKLAAKKVQLAAVVNLGCDIAQDGIIGPKTIAACEGNGLRLAWNVLALRRGYYTNLARQKPSLKVFLKGWLNRVEDQENLIREHWGV